MQIKHTFLLTLVLGLVWTGYLFGYAFGPDPGVNGIFGAGQTCASAGCHTGNAVNSGTGSVTLAGLPAEWTPGQTYPLTVTIQRTGSTRFGFQLSAISDSGNLQAGTLAPGARVKVICGRATSPNTIEVPCSTAGAIQYAEHSNATVVASTYTVNWTAPANASFGTVRFNVAGNAANGDSSNLGDFIYTRVDRVNPAATQPVDQSIMAFTMVNRGGVSVITDGSGDLNVGYSRIQPEAGKSTPAGVAIFGLTQNGTVVSEAGVPASPLVTNARIYAEAGQFANTGIAIANPNGVAASVDFKFTDSSGNDFGSGNLLLAPNEQTAKFLDQAPFNAPKPLSQASLTVTSNVPVSLVALRGLVNERGEFLITTLPVTDLAAAPATGTVILPHFADGEGWTTQIILVNPTGNAITGSLQFFGRGTDTAAATPVTVNGNGTNASSFNYSIPRNGSFRLITAGTSAPLATGSVRVTPAAGAASPSALVVFSFRQAGVTVSEAGVLGVSGNNFRMYAEQTATEGIGALLTGFAIANPAAQAATATLELFGLDGNPTGQLATVTIPGNGQLARFLHQVFPGISLPFKGILRVSSGAPLGVVALRGRFNSRNDFLITTTPPTEEGLLPSTAEQVFPQVVNGGGYTTQFVLYSGSAGQITSGNLKFVKQDGSAFNLNVN